MSLLKFDLVRTLFVLLSIVINYYYRTDKLTAVFPPVRKFYTIIQLIYHFYFLSSYDIIYSYIFVFFLNNLFPAILIDLLK